MHANILDTLLRQPYELVLKFIIASSSSRPISLMTTPIVTMITKVSAALVTVRTSPS